VRTLTNIEGSYKVLISVANNARGTAYTVRQHGYFFDAFRVSICNDRLVCTYYDTRRKARNTVIFLYCIIRIDKNG